MALEKKHITLISLTVLAVVGIGILFAPPHIKDKVARVMYSQQPERQCYKEYEDSFKDPDTAYLVSSRVLERVDGVEPLQPVLRKYPEAIEIVVAAKNSFGAYKREEFQCPTVRGEVNSTDTLIWKLRNI